MVAIADIPSSGTDGSAESRIPASALSSRMPVIDDLEALATLLGCRPRLFLRQSPGPAHDMATTVAMTVTRLAPEPWWSGSIIDWAAFRLDSVPTQRSEDWPWLLTADITDRGSGDQLLVQTAYIRPVAWIDDAVIEAAERHRATTR